MYIKGMPNRTSFHITYSYLMIAFGLFMGTGLMSSCSKVENEVVVIDVQPVIQEVEKVAPTEVKPPRKEEDEEQLSFADELAKKVIKKIVETTLVEPQSDLILSLPAVVKEENDKKTIVFKVSKDGTVFKVIEGKEDIRLGVLSEMEAKEKSDALQDALKGGDVVNGKPVVKITADPKTKADKVIDLLNLLVEHGVTKLTFTENSKNLKEANLAPEK